MDWLDSDAFATYLSVREPFARGGAVLVSSVERFSRNTVICRFRWEGKCYVAKVSVSKGRDVAEREYRQLVEFRDRQKESSAVGALVPMAHYADEGVIVTEEVPGESLREWVCMGMETAERSDVRERVEHLVAQAAEALGAFHATYEADGGGGFEVPRLYLDFSPSNLLVSGIAAKEWTQRLVLLDLPEDDRAGSGLFDVGTFCFELGRCALRAGRFLPPQHAWINRLKRTFIETYAQDRGAAASHAVFSEVRVFEEQRIAAVLGYYRAFRRFRNPVREFLRFLTAAPVIIWYRRVILPASYRWMEVNHSS